MVGGRYTRDAGANDGDVRISREWTSTAFLCEWICARGIYPEGLCGIGYRKRRGCGVHGTLERELLFCMDVEEDGKGSHGEQRNYQSREREVHATWG